MRSTRHGSQGAPYLGTIYLPPNKRWIGWYGIKRTTGDQSKKSGRRVKAANIVMRGGDFNAKCSFGHRVGIGEDDLFAKAIAAERMGQQEVFV